MRALITGSNRGLGLELARQIAARPGGRILAACRQPESAEALHRLAAEWPGRVALLPLDVTDPDQIAALPEAVRARLDGLDLLINNAGINLPQQTLATITADTFRRTMETNALGPLLVAQAVADLLRAGRSPRLVNISSDMASLGDGPLGGGYAYRASKAALNMLTVTLAHDPSLAGVITVAIHPGWVQTDMGGPGARLPVEEAALSVLDVIDGLKPEDNGCFLDWDGSGRGWQGERQETRGEDARRSVEAALQGRGTAPSGVMDRPTEADSGHVNFRLIVAWGCIPTPPPISMTAFLAWPQVASPLTAAGFTCRELTRRPDRASL